MVKRFIMIGLLSISLVAMLRSDAKAQYEYLGSGWDFCSAFGICSYHHSMKFKVPGNVVNGPGTIFFLSDAVWYDNLVICRNKGGNITFNPGVGFISTEATAVVNLQTSCVNRGPGGECEETVVYPTSVAELEDPDALAACRAAVGDPNASPQNCFLKFYNLAQGDCRKNGTPIEIRTKGLCAVATAKTCTDSSCPPEAQQGVRFTFPNFDQAPGNSFAQQVDASCVECVASGGLSGCTP